MKNHRKPAVAGIFYPGNSTQLKQEVDSYITSSSKQTTNTTKFLIVPHAGYVYSGRIAGKGYSEIQSETYKRVMLLGPSHRHFFKNMAESEEECWDIPSGSVKISFLDNKKILKNSQYHADEHCLEVQLPFIQYMLPEAKVTPLLLSGSYNNAKKYADTLQSFDTDETLWVISSDFNHVGPNFQHHPEKYGFGSGEAMDLQAIDYIISGDIEGFIKFMEKIQATICGALSILVAMHLIKKMDLPAFTLKDYDCSGKQTGDINSVGYAALYA